MNIRSYLNDDMAAVIALWNRCGLVTPHNDPVKDIERKLKVDPDLFLVGLNNTEIIASVMGGYEGHRGWINYLAVKPSYQRRGYGEEIMRAMEVCLTNKGCPKINLQVRAENKDVVAFYAAIGYVNDDVVGLGKRFIADG